MYFKMLLVFSGAVCTYAQRSYEFCYTYGCSDSSESQFCATLDGDEVCYADFKKGVLFWDSRLPTSLQIAGAYEYATLTPFACRYFLDLWKKDKSATTKTKGEPEMIIYPRDEVKKEEENTLICFINHFFPPYINIKWTKNDVEVAEEDPFTRCLPNPDGTFYVFSTLDFVPKEGDIYSCTVKHESLETPQTNFWEVETNEISIGPSVFCGLGLSLGLLGVAAGIFFFMKANRCPSLLEA